MRAKHTDFCVGMFVKWTALPDPIDTNRPDQSLKSAQLWDTRKHIQ